MKKPTNEAAATITANAAAPAKDEAAPVVTFETLKATVPSKEHRTFEQSDYDKAITMSYPTNGAELKAIVKASNANTVFALFLFHGKDEAVKLSKALLEEKELQMKASAVASFKSVAKGGTEFWAGKMAYGALSLAKNS